MDRHGHAHYAAGTPSVDTITNKKNRKKLDALIDDLRYTVMVARRTGLDVRRASLVVISADFRLGMENEKLFTVLGETEAVNERLPAFEKLWDTIGMPCTARLRPNLA